MACFGFLFFCLGWGDGYCFQCSCLSFWTSEICWRIWKSCLWLLKCVTQSKQPDLEVLNLQNPFNLCKARLYPSNVRVLFGKSGYCICSIWEWKLEKLNFRNISRFFFPCHTSHQSPNWKNSIPKSITYKQVNQVQSSEFAQCSESHKGQISIDNHRIIQSSRLEKISNII